MASRFAKNAVILGLLTAVGPFAIDMYLPALPSIAADLQASTAATQMTLMAFFLSFGIFQLIYGPVSDMIGRKPPLYFGLVLFIVGSIGCGLAPSIGWLIACRLLQGAGASAPMVIPRAIIRDLHTGFEATRLMSLVMLVFSVSPILAPLLGSALIVPFGWRAVFVAVTGAALAGLAMIALSLTETREQGDRVRTGVGAVLRGFESLLQDRQFMGLTFIGGLGMSSFFAYLASSSFVYINHFGLSPTGYSLAFSINAIGFIGASQLASWLGARYGTKRVVFLAVAAYSAAATLTCLVTAVGVDNLMVLIVLLFISFAWLGLVIPSTMVLSLEEHGAIAGMASALGGTLQMVTGGVMIVVASFFFDGTPLPMVTIIAGCSLAALALSMVTLRRRRGPVAVSAS